MAVVGCGRIAAVHCRYIKTVPGVQLAAVCDPIEESAQRLGNAFQVAARFTDLARMLAEVEPAAVHVLTPPSTHAEVAIAAMESGAHVLVEKPMTARAPEADQLLAAAARTGRTVCVDHNRWFDPVMQQAAELLRSGALGELAGAEVFQGAAVGEAQATAAGATRNWRADMPGGVMHDLAPHPVYLLRNLLGPIRDMQVIGVTSGEVLQEVRAVAAGTRAVGVLSISMRARPMMNTVRLIGTRQTAEVNLNNMTLIVRREHGGPKLASKVLPNVVEAGQLLASTIRNGIAFATGKQRYFPGMGVLIARFYEHLRRGTPPPTTGEEGRDVVRLLDQIWAETAAPSPQRAFA